MGDAAREGGRGRGGKRERERKGRKGEEGGERGREGGRERRRVERWKTECRYEGEKIGKEGNERYREVSVHIIIHHVSSKRWYGHYKLQSGFWSLARISFRKVYFSIFTPKVGILACLTNFLDLQTLLLKISLI